MEDQEIEISEGTEKWPLIGPIPKEEFDRGYVRRHEGVGQEWKGAEFERKRGNFDQGRAEFERGGIYYDLRGAEFERRMWEFDERLGFVWILLEKFRYLPKIDRNYLRSSKHNPGRWMACADRMLLTVR
ncbi:hypothetical protein M5K25_028088 [Dendrobium thyrsiflorum]|uniref:Uncharacterized protein n=1 Tax=Dendrobium thyrsiflorum TaxID=117978 RepID=A0ABD0TVP5_DENTH